MTTTLYDPTGELAPDAQPRLPRLGSLQGKTIGLLDISKARGDVFLERLSEHLEERGARVARFRKPTFAKVAPFDLRKKIAESCDAVIEALAD